MRAVFLRLLILEGLALLGLAALAPNPAYAQSAPVRPPIAATLKTLRDSVLPVVSRAAFLGRMNPQQNLFVVVGLKFPHPEETQAYADAVSNPVSPLYRRFLTPQEAGKRFGPSEADYQQVIDYLRGQGLKITETPVTRMIVAAEGTVAQVESAFGTKVNRYQESAVDRARRAGINAPPLTFFANATPARLPATLAPLVESVNGLENYVRPLRKFKRFAKGSAYRSTTPYAPSAIRTAYNTAPIYNSPNLMRGEGRTIGITNFDPIIATDTTKFISHFSLPVPAGGAASNITTIKISGGSSGSSQGEGNLDVQMAVGMAPLANIRIYDAPGTTASYIALLSKIVTDNLVDIETESYGWNIAQSTTNSAHNQHILMTTQGITYLIASGDSGTSIDPFAYPNIDPEVLIVGGTVVTLNASNVITNEVGWSDSGGGTSNYTLTFPFTNFNVLPSWQQGRGVPLSPDRRLMPDIALHSSGNNANSAGAYLFYFGGGLTTGIGTSFASPTSAGCLALVEQYLISLGALPADIDGNQRLGRLNDAIYAMNGRNDVWRDTTSGNNGFTAGSYWDFVTGWGSPNFFNLATALKDPLAISLNPNAASVVANTTKTIVPTVTGSNVTTVTWSVVSGPGSVNASGVYTAPATVASNQSVTVRATSTIDTNPLVTADAVLIVVPTALTSLGLDASTVNAGTPVTATLTFNGPVAANTVVTLSSNDISAATVPANATLSSGQSAKTFTVTTKAVLRPHSVTITAIQNGVTKTATLTINPNTADGTGSSVGAGGTPGHHGGPGKR